MGFKRPLVQIQSLGPNNRESRKALPVIWSERKVRTPAASCNTIKAALRPWRRPSPLRPLVQIQSLGPTRERVSKDTLSLVAPRSAPRSRAKIRFAQIYGRGSPSLPNPPHAFQRSLSGSKPSEAVLIRRGRRREHSAVFVMLDGNGAVRASPDDAASCLSILKIL